jgi:nicotinamidase-related amidase
MSMNVTRCALVVVDVQRGFDDEEHWGRRNNPSCEDNIGKLIDAFRGAGRPIVFVRHDSVESNSPLRPGLPGNAFKAVIRGTPDVLITKNVHSAFLGTPDLAAWLRARDLESIVVCGITTNHCCDTTARMGANLGFQVFFALDATHAFDRRAPDGQLFTADELSRMTVANLNGEFATIASTDDLVRAFAVKPLPHYEGEALQSRA